MKTALPVPEEILEKYELEEALGRGAQGAVFRALQKGLQRSVVLKILWVGFDTEGQLARRAIREGKALAKLHHPAIVELLDYGSCPPAFYMAYPDDGGVGITARTAERWRAGAPLRGFFEAVLSGLDVAHSEGILHRDIKPGNLLGYPDGSVKIIDFGMALLQDERERLTGTGLFLGTPLYCAPQQITATGTDPRDDLYSLGVVSYLLATGNNPFRADTLHGTLDRQMTHRPPPLSAVRPDLGQELSDFVEALMEKEREDRPGSAADALRWLADTEIPKFEVEPDGSLSRLSTKPGFASDAVPVLQSQSASLSTLPSATAEGSRGKYLSFILTAVVLCLVLSMGFMPEARLPGPPAATTPSAPAAAMAAKFTPHEWSVALQAQLKADDDLQGRDEGAMPWLTSNPALLESQYERKEALVEARRWIAAGGRPHRMTASEKAALKAGEAALARFRIPSPFRPFLEFDSSARSELPSGDLTAWAPEFLSLGNPATGWRGELMWAGKTLRSALKKADHFLESQEASPDQEVEALRRLYDVRRIMISDRDGPSLDLGEAVAGFPRHYATYSQLMIEVSRATRRMVYVCIQGAQEEPASGDVMALAAREALFLVRKNLYVFVASVPEELFGGLLPRTGPMALVSGRLAHVRAQIQKVDGRGSAPWGRGVEESPGAFATRLWWEAAETPLASPYAKRRRRDALADLWREAYRWTDSEVLTEWLERMRPLLDTLDDEARYQVLRRMVIACKRRGQIERYRPELQRITREYLPEERLKVQLLAADPRDPPMFRALFSELERNSSGP